jgi:hypothetical protein
LNRTRASRGRSDPPPTRCQPGARASGRRHSPKAFRRALAPGGEVPSLARKPGPAVGPRSPNMGIGAAGKMLIRRSQRCTNWLTRCESFRNVLASDVVGRALIAAFSQTFMHLVTNPKHPAGCNAVFSHTCLRNLINAWHETNIDRAAVAITGTIISFATIRRFGCGAVEDCLNFLL